MLRLTARQREVLDAIAHLEAMTSNAYAHQVLVSHLAQIATDPAVKRDIENRRAYRASTGSVSRLSAKRQAADKMP
jgi:hypothetical protein